MNVWTIIACVILSFPGIFLIYALLQSAWEKEKRASLRLFVIVMMMITGLSVLIIWSNQIVLSYIFCSSALIFLLGTFIILFPWPEKELAWKRGKPDQVDERNIMFSRAELLPGSDRYNSYYEEFPHHKDLDDAFRQYDGLLSTKGTFYNPWIFGAADATFHTVSSLHPFTDGSINKTRKEYTPDEITTFISTWASELGSHSIGVTKLCQHHLYHTGGRKHNYGEEVKNSHTFAIAFTVEMDFQRVSYSPRGPIIMESATQYLNSGTIAVQIAAFIRGLGYSARAHIDGKYQVRCPEVAKDAGLGELGRLGLLMTPDLGPRVRIGVITTDLPLRISSPQANTSLLKFCHLCKKCAETCPSQAVSYDEPKEVGGTTQWVINQEACFTYWCKVGTDCGRCISVCPYSHPNNLLHKLVRVFIKKAPLFRLIAFRLDNWLYGRKPPEKLMPSWMTPKSSLSK